MKSTVEVMDAAMSADPVRDGEHAHGLGDPRVVAEGLGAVMLDATPRVEVVSVSLEGAMPTELTFAEVAQHATRWTRA